jgi:hypothetical protein
LVEGKSWDEFRNSGLLWWINMILHTFGWAIVFYLDEEGKVADVIPARVSFRGFDYKSNDEGYRKVTNYLKENIEELYDEPDFFEED